MGVWQGIERGIGAIRERDERAAERKAEQDRFDQQMGFRREQFEESKRQWGEEHKIRVATALGKILPTRNTDRKDSKDSTLSQKGLTERAIQMGLSNEVMTDMFAQGAPWSEINKALDAYQDHAEKNKGMRTLVPADTYFSSIPWGEYGGEEYDLTDHLKKLGFDPEQAVELGYDVKGETEKGKVFNHPLLEDRLTIDQMEAVRVAQENVVTSYLQVELDRLNSTPVDNLSPEDAARKVRLDKAIKNEGGAAIRTAHTLFDEATRNQILFELQEIHPSHLAGSVSGFLPPEPVTPAPSSSPVGGGLMSVPGSAVDEDGITIADLPPAMTGGQSTSEEPKKKVGEEYPPYYSELEEYVKSELQREEVVWPSNEEELETFLQEFNSYSEKLNIPTEVKDKIVKEASENSIFSPKRSDWEEFKEPHSIGRTMVFPDIEPVGNYLFNKEPNGETVMVGFKPYTLPQKGVKYKFASTEALKKYLEESDGRTLRNGDIVLVGGKVVPISNIKKPKSIRRSVNPLGGL